LVSIAASREEIKRLAEEYGYLPYMISRYLDLFGKTETLKMLEANERPPARWIRTNTLKITPEELRSRLVAKGFTLEKSEWIQYAFKVVEEPLNIGSLHEYLQGYYYIQDLASMLPPHILNPHSGEIIIDMAASPGGKSTHLAQLMNNDGFLILIERNKKRIPALEINIRRMGVSNSIIFNFDSRNLTKLQIKADKILLDAPCTGEGLIQLDPLRKKSKTYKDITKMTTIQEKLLQAGLNSLKSGGQLLYSTCSIAPEENELVINNILNEKKNVEIKQLEQTLGNEGFTMINNEILNRKLKFSQRFYPHIHNTIGFYVCLLVKH
jgi:NOL1/NOP2/sun family putative RNA methylase